GYTPLEAIGVATAAGADLMGIEAGRLVPRMLADILVVDGNPVILSDLFVDTEQLRECFEHLRFRKHDVAAFHLLDPEELDFAFQRPTRFLDMEGGTAVFADPIEIADRYHRALNEYLESLQKVVLETAVDYRRISIDSAYEKELTNFLVDRAHRRSAR
ncbi:MAG: DUF58 domain-containing protein, partial [Planctomycetota bacterium]